MTLQERIHGDLKIAMKEKNEERKSALRVILGELARLEAKTLPDDEVVRVLRKLQKSEMEVMARTGAAESAYLAVVESYLPDMATDAEIRAWIDGNIDFSSYKSRLQAMGVIMKHFGQRADGNRVKRILQEG